MAKVFKRDGREVDFDTSRPIVAMERAYKATYNNDPDQDFHTLASNIALAIEKVADKKDLSVEDIQNSIESKLMASKYKDVAKNFIIYRNKRSEARENTTDKSVIDYLNGRNVYLETENSNKNAKVLSTQRDYLAGILSTDITRRYLLPEDIKEAHDEGIIHFHDIDYFAENAITNCSLINLEDMLQNGTVMNGVRIDKPHRFITACTIATQIILGVTSNQYGGCTVSITHLAPFLRSSYELNYKIYKDRGLSEDLCKKYADEDTQRELESGVQTFNYQINSMANSNGQSPFVSVFMYLNEDPEYKHEIALITEEFFKQRMLGLKNKVGVYVTQAFPKLLYVLEDDNISDDSEYWWLTKLAAQCTAKRMVPDYISEKKMKELKSGDCFPCMGCRSFLMPYKDKDGKSKYYGRLNMGVVTLNLVDLGLSAGHDKDKFWRLFEERTELCHRALRIRYERLAKVTSDVAPLLWQDGAFARLPEHTPIEPLLRNNYASISLGYAGLYECVKAVTGKDHFDNAEGTTFALEIMKALKAKCDKWQKEEQIGYSLYGSPIETTTYKFAKSAKKRFGNDVFVKLDGHDRNYVTNSVHIPVFVEVDPYTKLKFEAQFQPYSTGGYISYIECADLTHNIDAVLSIIKYIYENTMYAELNTKSDYCQVCGYSGEIKIVDEGGKLDWVCPNCGNRDHSKMNVARRTCGYIGTNFWSEGRTDEIRNRYVHLDDHMIKE